MRCAADFKGDGRTDVLVYRPNDGAFAKWYSDGGADAGFQGQAVGYVAGAPGRVDQRRDGAHRLERRRQDRPPGLWRVKAPAGGDPAIMGPGMTPQWWNHLSHLLRQRREGDGAQAVPLRHNPFGEEAIARGTRLALTSQGDYPMWTARRVCVRDKGGYRRSP
jgi:hypothetical protein